MIGHLIKAWIRDTIYSVSQFLWELPDRLFGPLIQPDTKEVKTAKTDKLMKQLSVRREHPCPECKGSGWIEKTEKFCENCSGFGVDPAYFCEKALAWTYLPEVPPVNLQGYSDWYEYAYTISGCPYYGMVAVGRYVTSAYEKYPGWEHNLKSAESYGYEVIAWRKVPGPIKQQEEKNETD